MKNIVLLTFAMATSLMGFAQKGEIIYTDFEPDSTVHFHDNYGIQPPNLYLDIDHDGTDDWYFERRIGPQATFLACFEPLLYGDRVTNYGFSFGTNMSELYWHYYVDYDYVPNGWPPPHQYPPHFLAIRHQIDENVYCYGWIEVSVEFREDGRESDVTVYRMAYCTIPNYPFCVGQTDFTIWSTEESEATDLTTVHPNPTTGTATIIGQGLKSAEVYNTLGQHVASATGDDEWFTVDLSGLPVGVYFVNITGEEGRKCVRKVVKE